jgi:lactate racemase
MVLTQGGTNPLSEAEVSALFTEAFAHEGLAGKSVLFIIPDSTRSFPARLVVSTIHKLLSGTARKVDFLIALGTHRPMSEESITAMVGGPYTGTCVFNHQWADPAALKDIGVIGKARIAQLTGGLFSQDVPIAVNRKIFDYDRVLIVGPVFPHEVVGFSGGHKYIFPGVGAAEFINFFHWFAAVITNPKIIGNKDTPVRALIEEAASMLPITVGAFCLAMRGKDLVGMAYSDAAYKAWEAACEYSRALHIVPCDAPYRSVLACSPLMYDDLWTGGKCAYKTENIVADGGELIIYAPHITEVSYTHGKVLDAIGYHTRDFFLAQWEKYKGYPWGVVAHSTHVKGIGTYEKGVEKPRITVKLATGIPRERCEKICLPYVDYRAIKAEDWQHSADRLYLDHAGEMLYRLKDPPAWQRP